MSETTAAPQNSGQNIGIAQLNLAYDAHQDRLLFRVALFDNSELQIWLTNRVAKEIWQLLSGKTHLPTASSIAPQASPAEAVAQFQQELQATEALQKMDFKTPYTARDEVMNNQPMLVTNVLLHSQNGKPQALELPCLEGINVRINLNQELILALCNMLQLSSKEAAWNTTNLPPMLVAESPAIAIAIEGDKKVLH